VLVLGKTNDDKGTQLETLTGRLLSARQYRNICKNWIGPGGEEIDVRAEYLVPTFKDHKTFKVICECKAYKSAVGITDWLKFCGKIYVEQQTQSKDTHGCFIALSGVNGNVRGSYDELKKHEANIELITGDDLLDLIRKVYSLADLKLILDAVKPLTDRVCRETEVVYYAEQVYWLLLFEGESYTVLRGDGKAVTVGEVAGLGPMIEATVSAKHFVNLEEEAQAKERARAAETAVVACLMLAGGTGTVASMAKPADGPTQEEMEGAAERLTTQHVIDGDPKGELALPEDDYKRVAELYRTLFRAPCDSEVLGCAWYDSHINRCLLEVIREIQCGLPLSENDFESSIKILRLSPLGLGYSLHPIAMITQHRQGDQTKLVADPMDQMDRDYFFKVICDSLQRDFTHPGLSQYFYTARGMRELELNGSHILKSQTGVVAEEKFRQRHRLAPFEPAKGHPVLVLIRNDVGEPWQEMSPPFQPPTRPVEGEAVSAVTTDT
jgi:hypothetical protein